MDKPPHDTLVPQRRGVVRWPMTITTERADPLRRWNPSWGGLFHGSATGRRRTQSPRNLNALSSKTQRPAWVDTLVAFSVEEIVNELRLADACGGCPAPDELAGLRPAR